VSSQNRSVDTCPVTDEHRRILRQLVDGWTDAEIAASSYLSERTVRRRIREVMEAHQIRTRMQLAAECVRRGWIDEKPGPRCDCTKPTAPSGNTFARSAALYHASPLAVADFRGVE
jgi:DNA-binding CsgD family transcriptional regulator